MDVVSNQISRVAEDSSPSLSHCDSEPYPANARSFESVDQRFKNLRILRFQSAITDLVFGFTTWDGLFEAQPTFFLFSTIITTLLIFWDLLGFACTQNRFALLPLEVCLVVELAFFGTFVFLVYGSIRIVNLSLGVTLLENGVAKSYNGSLFKIKITTSVFILLTTGFHIYHCIRACPTHWQYRQDYRKIKPILVFTEQGSPVAIFPPSEETIVQRLSVDSLEHSLAE
ncbi:hypothetical protein F4808DRAFT_441450 [Astrocystis sublimbata]|nr:hypothetical protein F4808DRAFT_441450 [Astrocystis sublimbata]